MKRSSRLLLAAIIGLSGALSTALLSLRSSAELSRAKVIEASIGPVISVADAGLGGSVTEVCAHTNQQVREGQVLVRFEAAPLREKLKDLDEAERSTLAEIAGRGILERVPARLKRYLYETHPDVVASEQEYVVALERWENAPESERAALKVRLNDASEKRTRARLQLDRVLASSGGADGFALILRNIRQSRVELQRLLAKQEVRARANGFVDILDLKPGDKVLPGFPAAAVRVPDEYTADLIVPHSAAAKFRQGGMVSGSVNDATFATVVQTVGRRKVPAAFRENRELEEDTIVTVRFHSDHTIVPGSTAKFYLP